jgi:WD40 repeat protein
MPPRYDVFLSHSSADKPAVEEIAHKLREKGVEPFLDKWHLVPGKVWQEELESALEDSGACAIFIGSEGLGPWVKQEMRVVLDRGARDSGFPVIPVLLPGIRKPARIPSFLGQRTWVEFGADLKDEEAIHRLMAGIRGEAPGPGDVKSSDSRSNYRSMAVPPQGFIYRKEYDRVVDALCAENPHGSAVGITTALRGAGGFGKTALAQAVCQDERIRKKYPDGILWTTMGDIDTNVRLSRILDLIREWTAQEPPGFENIIAAGSHLRKLLTGLKILLVIDDIWSPLDLTPFQGLGPEGALLVTTRNSQALPVDAQRIEVDAMASTEAVSLLQSGLPDYERRTFEALTRRLGEWPLLLKIINRQLRELTKAGLTVEEALREIEEALDAAGLTAFDLEDQEDRQRAVSQTINVSLKKLSGEERNRYKKLAIFPEDSFVPLSVLERLWGLNRFETKKLCGRLHELSLLLDFDRRAGTIRLHDVVRQFLIRQWGDELPSLHGHLLDVCPCWPQLPKDEEYLWRHLSYHLLAADRNGELRKLLLDFDYLQAKLKATDANALLGDYEGLSKNDEELRLIQGSIRLSAHILAKDPEQLAPHLLGRLLGGETAGLKHLLEQCRSASRFRPRAPSFRPPGPLIRTIEVGSPVNAMAMVDSRRAVSGSYDGTLRVWDLETGQTLRTLEGHTASVKAVAVVNSRSAVSGSYDGTLRVWDLETGQTLRTLEGHTASVWAVAVVDGRRAVSGSDDGTLRVWDLETGQTLRTLQRHNTGIIAVALVYDRLAISGSYDGTLQVRDQKTGQTLRSLEGHTAEVSAVAVMDGRRAVSGSYDGTLRVWDLETGQSLRSLQRHKSGVSVVAVIDSRRAVSGSSDRTLRVWDLETGETLQFLHGHRGGVSAVAVLDDRRAVSGSFDRTLRVWDLETGQTLGVLRGDHARVGAVAVVDDRRIISGSYNGTLRVWDFETEQILQSPQKHKSGVHTVAVIDRRRAVSGSFEGTLRVWDLETGQTLRTLKGHNSRIWVVAVMDSQRVVSGSDDRTLRIWDLETGQTLRTLEGHTDWVRAVAVVDGRRAVSGSNDGTLRVWDLETGQCLAMLVLEAAVTSVAVAPDGRTVVAGDASGRVHFLELDEQ